jgi:acyl carrier protein
VKGEELRQAVREVVLEILELEAEELDDDLSFVELGSDSVAKVEMIVALERRFDLRFSPQQSFDSVNDLLSSLRQAQES